MTKEQYAEFEVFKDFSAKAFRGMLYVVRRAYGDHHPVTLKLQNGGEEFGGNVIKEVQDYALDQIKSKNCSRRDMRKRGGD